MSLWTINKARVTELAAGVQANSISYVETPLNMPNADMSIPTPDNQIFGIVPTVPEGMIRAQKRFMELRQQMIDAGGRLLSDEELNRKR